MSFVHRAVRTFKKPMIGRCYGVLVLVSFSVAAQATPLDERAALQQLCRDGPARRVARAQRLQGQAQVTASQILPNPTLVLEHQRALGGGADEDETVVGLSVPLGLSGRFFVLQDAASPSAASPRATRSPRA